MSNDFCVIWYEFEFEFEYAAIYTAGLRFFVFF